MRKLRNQQLPLTEVTPDHPKAKELAKISEILDTNSSIYNLVLQDLENPYSNDDNESGAKGMSAEQILRAANHRHSDIKENQVWFDCKNHLQTFCAICRAMHGNVQFCQDTLVDRSVD
ncbi:MAG: hypothetical protein N2A40_00625 [Desulfobulbaceae bacterium]